jgi:hypothetical protein
MSLQPSLARRLGGSAFMSRSPDLGSVLSDLPLHGDEQGITDRPQLADRFQRRCGTQG